MKKYQLDIASRYYHKALEIKPDATHIYRFLGDVSIKQGRRDEAEHFYHLSNQ